MGAESHNPDDDKIQSQGRKDNAAQHHQCHLGGGRASDVPRLDHHRPVHLVLGRPGERPNNFLDCDLVNAVLRRHGVAPLTADPAHDQHNSPATSYRNVVTTPAELALARRPKTSYVYVVAGPFDGD